MSNQERLRREVQRELSPYEMAERSVVMDYNSDLSRRRKDLIKGESGHYKYANEEYSVW